jgi:GT2 family glycosyltransferase
MDDALTEEQEPALPAWRAAPPTVGAVLVTHDGGRWLPQVLTSLAGLEHAPTTWRVVDVSSTDDGPELVREAFGADRVTYAPAGTGFGDAVRLALASMPRTDWVWLLHDDAVVRPDALAALLDEATAADDVAVVGPKIREWPSLRRLLEVGLTLTSTGSRETGLETGEPDAGQHDWPKDVLAVNTAGMLVRRDVWDELGGLAPDLPLFLDDVDLGWRVARAGYRTRVAPRAVLFHAEASRRGTRRRAAGDVEPWEERRAALHVLLANTSGPRFWWQYVRLLVGTLLRTLGHVVSAAPERAGDELQALVAVYGRPGRLREARRRRAATARRDDRAVKHLFAPFWLPYRHGFDAARDVVAALVRPEAVETTGRRSVLDEEDGDVPLDDGPPLWVRRPWLVTVAVLTLLSLVAARGLVVGDDGGALVGGALGVTPGSAGDWWRVWFERSHDVGLGSTALVGPAVLLLALASTPVWPAPGLVVGGLLVLAVPLAALTAHRLGRRLTDHRRARIVWAAGYGLTVAASGAVSEGRLGTVVALVVLPIVVVTTLQVAGVDPLAAGSPRRAALRWGIWVAVGTAFAPIVLPLAVVGVLLLAVVHRAALRPLALGLVAAVVLAGPWLAGRVLHPGLWWVETGRVLEGGSPGWGTALGLLVGRAGSPEQAPAWLGAGLVLLAVVALLDRAARPVVVLCWSLALAALAVAVVGVLVPVGLPGGGPLDLRAWVGVPAGAVALALGTAALVGVPPLLAGRGRPVVAGALVVALLLPVGTALWWVARGAVDPLDRGRPGTVPAFLTERRGDTLVVRGATATGIQVEVVRGEGPLVGEEGLQPSEESRRTLVSAVESLLSAPGADAVRRLADLGVDAVYAPDVDTDVARALDAAPLLEPSGSDAPTSRVWTVDEPADAPRPDGPAWRPFLAAAQLLLWVAAVVLTAPVRRRPPPGDDDPVDAPAPGRRVLTDGGGR